MPNQFVTYPFPIGGMNKRWPTEGQPQVTTIDAVNVRPTDSIGQRERGGSRPGLAKGFAQFLGTAGGSKVTMLQTVRFVQNEQVKSKLCAACGGSLFMENDYGEMILSVSSPVLSRFNNIQAVDLENNLYIANTGRGLTGDWVSGSVGGGVQICTPTNTPYQHQICYIGTSGDITNSDVTQERLGYDSAPLKFDPVAKTMAVITASAGTVPVGCQIIAVYRGRLVLAGAPTDPQQWFMSKLLDPTDWDYSATGDDRAVSGTNSKAGKIGAPITALCPFTDLCLVMAARTSLWILRGDPVTGHMDNLSHEIGIIDKNAWCTTASGDMVFLSHDGVYSVPANCTAGRPMSISREVLPDELLNVDPNLYTVNLAYDVKDRGVHIFLSPNYPEYESQHWFLDWEPRSEMRSFFRVELANADFNPFSVCHRRDVTSDQSTVMLGCDDGYIRYFDSDAEDDDGEVFDSSVLYGPILPDGDNEELTIRQISGKLDALSGPVQWQVLTGDSAEEAAEATASKTGRISTGGKVIWSQVNLTAGAFYIRLTARTPGSAWSIEKLLLGLFRSACGACSR